MNAMKKWMAAATVAEQEELAKLAVTSRAYLYQIAIGHRIAQAELAGRLETAAATLRKRNKHLPKLLRTELALVCEGCPYAKKCLIKKGKYNGK